MIVDLRSDTVTKPSPGMRQAMAEAEVGDDVFGEDPTAVLLQERIAELLGKEAALFVPSGVMGNQLGVKVHTSPGDEVILARNSHIFNYESGAAGLLSGVQLNVLETAHGLLDAEHVEQAIRPGHYWMPRTRLVCLENTVNQAGGIIYPLQTLQAAAEVARQHGLGLHLDGARLWNASAATGIAEREFSAPFDTVSVCLSKGLGAPVGSVLAGSRRHIDAAHRYRKMFGGGMRQIGILAAAGLYALEHNLTGLAADHANARQLAEGINCLAAFHVDMDSVQTNIVMFDVSNGPAAPVVEALRERGILLSAFGPSTIRATTHLDVSADGIAYTLGVMQELYA